MSLIEWHRYVADEELWYELNGGRPRDPQTAGAADDPETWELAEPRHHLWFHWDDITRLEVH